MSSAKWLTVLWEGTGLDRDHSVAAWLAHLIGEMSSEGAAAELQVRKGKGRLEWGDEVEGMTARALKEDMTLWLRPWALVTPLLGS